MSARRVLVTGAGRGIGRAIALAFAREGAQLALLARSQDQLEAVAEEVREAGGVAHVIVADLSAPHAVAPAAQRAVAALGGAVDVVINNAGIFDMRPIEELTLEFWEQMLAINLTAPMLVTQAALPGLEAGQDAVVILVASVAAETGYPGNTAYCASKYGFTGVANALRDVQVPLVIAVPSIDPRASSTVMFDYVPRD